MKKTALFLALCASICLAQAKGGHAAATASPHSGSHSVSGHVTKGGTYVAPHQQTNPNSTKRDNWSSKGNVNPYTGKNGTKDPDATK